MKAQTDKLDECLMKEGHLFGCKLVDDAGFFWQHSTLTIFICTPSRDFATNSAKPINSLLSKLSNWSFGCCQLSFPCQMDETYLHPRSPPAFFFSDQQQNLWVFSAELIHILPDCSWLQTPSGGYSRKLQTTSPKASSSHISLASPAVRSVSNRLI